jgi:hypothetical protein
MALLQHPTQLPNTRLDASKETVVKSEADAEKQSDEELSPGGESAHSSDSSFEASDSENLLAPAPRRAPRRESSGPRVFFSAAQKKMMKDAAHAGTVSHRLEHLEARQRLARDLTAQSQAELQGQPPNGAPAKVNPNVSESQVRNWLVNYAARLKKRDPKLGKLLMTDMAERGNSRQNSADKEESKGREQHSSSEGEDAQSDGKQSAEDEEEEAAAEQPNSAEGAPVDTDAEDQHPSEPGPDREARKAAKRAKKEAKRRRREEKAERKRRREERQAAKATKKQKKVKKRRRNTEKEGHAANSNSGTGLPTAHDQS